MPTPRQNEQIKKDIERKETEAVAKETIARKDFISLEKTDEIALYYGFTPVEAPVVNKRDEVLAKMLKEIEINHKDHSPNSEVFNLCLEEECVLLANYQEKEFWKLPHPIMISYESASKKRKPKERHFNLHIMGAHQSIAEATILKTIMVILDEEGYKDLTVEINSLGDKDSIAKFNRELVAYYRKNISSLPAECKQTLKNDPLELLSCSHEKCKELAANAPKSLTFLTEKGRTHFKEVLEYLESMNIPYNINHGLVGKRFAAETVFEVRTSDDKMVALGMRYDALSKRIGLKKEVAAVGAQLVFESTEREKIKKGSPVTKKPKFYFIQLGFGAKLKSLRVIEILRQAKVPLYQSLSKDKLQGQMAVAENLKIPYTIIMGQKEAMEDSVIVRDMPTRSQNTVKIDELAKYIEKLK